MTPPWPPYRTPQQQRIARFQRRRPDIRITPWHASPTGQWEAAEPGRQPRTWPSNHADAMTDALETDYPPDPPGP